MRKVVESYRELAPGVLLVQRIFIERGVVKGFVVNLSAEVDGEMVEVCRYDTCHGHLHVHRNWLDRGELRDLENPKRPAKEYAAQLRIAWSDVSENWESYVAKMELKRK